MYSLIDPRLRAQISNRYYSTCLIYNKNRVQEGDTGQWVEGEPTLKLTRPCRIGPLILIRPTDGEDRLSKETRVVRTRQCDLDSYHPEIDVTNDYAVIDSVKYNILGIEEDGSKFKTRLRLEFLEPNGAA